MTVHIAVPERELVDFCQRNRIRRLQFFGSVLRDDFTAESDVDLLVEFLDGVRVRMFDLVRMEDELAALFGRKVDLFERSAVERSENYIRRRTILSSLETVYAA